MCSLQVPVKNITVLMPIMHAKWANHSNLPDLSNLIIQGEFKECRKFFVFVCSTKGKEEKCTVIFWQSHSFSTHYFGLWASWCHLWRTFSGHKQGHINTANHHPHNLPAAGLKIGSQISWNLNCTLGEKEAIFSFSSISTVTASIKVENCDTAKHLLLSAFLRICC